MRTGLLSQGSVPAGRFQQIPMLQWRCRGAVRTVLIAGEDVEVKLCTELAEGAWEVSFPMNEGDSLPVAVLLPRWLVPGGVQGRHATLVQYEMKMEEGRMLLFVAHRNGSFVFFHPVPGTNQNIPRALQVAGTGQQP